jgi:hypothetical protein
MPVASMVKRKKRTERHEQHLPRAAGNQVRHLLYVVEASKVMQNRSPPHIRW